MEDGLIGRSRSCVTCGRCERAIMAHQGESPPRRQPCSNALQADSYAMPPHSLVKRSIDEACRIDKECCPIGF